MKQLFLSVIILSAFEANAQQENIYKRKPWEQAKNQTLNNLKNNNLVPEVTPTNKQEEQDEQGVYKLPLTGKLLGKNEHGDDIYAMTPDNMPCLVPKKTKQNMPVTGLQNGNKSYKSPFKKQPQKFIHPADGDQLRQNVN